MRLLINAENVVKLVADLTRAYGLMETPCITIRHLGADKDNIEWFSVSLTRRQSKALRRLFEVLSIENRYECR